MNDAQTWTLIGGFFAVMVAMIGMMLRVVRAEIRVLDVRIDGLQSRLEARLDHLDRDVQAVINRLMER